MKRPIQLAAVAVVTIAGLAPATALAPQRALAGIGTVTAQAPLWEPGTQAAWSNVPEGDTGEMIREMMRVGAAVGQMEEMVGYQSSIAPGTEDNPVKPGVQSALASLLRARPTAKPREIVCLLNEVLFDNIRNTFKKKAISEA